MKKLIAILLLPLLAFAADKDIPYNQKRTDGTNQAMTFTPAAATMVVTDGSKALASMSAPGATRFLQINSDGTYTLMDASTFLAAIGAGSGGGTVSTVSVVTANGVSGSVATATSTPAITIVLGAITPTSVVASGSVSGSNLSGTNTGDISIATANGLSLAGQAISLGLASTSTTGALSSTDWNTFNGKQAAGNYITALTGDGTASGPGSAGFTLTTVNSNVGTFGGAGKRVSVTANAKGLITAIAEAPLASSDVGLGNVTNDVQTKASVVPNTTPTNGQVLIGNGTNYSVASISAGTGITVTPGAGTITIASTSSGGDVTGPASSTTNHIPQFADATGKVLKDGLTTSTGGNGSTDSGKVLLYDSSGAVKGVTFNTSNGGTQTGYYDSNAWQIEEAATGWHGDFVTDTLTADRHWKGPNKSGTFATTDDIPTKAWVNFDGGTSSNLAITYSRVGTTLTVHSVGHGHIAGHVVGLTFLTGGAASGAYTITLVNDADNYTVVTVASGTIAGGSTGTENRRSIRASSGVHDVAFENTGQYHVNFTAAFSDALYTSCGSAGTSGAVRLFMINNAVAPTAQSMQIVITDTASGAQNATYVNCSYFR